MRLTRRKLLHGIGHGIGIGSTLPLLSRNLMANQDTESLFLFIFCSGGWDQHAVFAPLFDAPLVDMEIDAQPAMIGNIPFVDHVSRPNVRQFMESHFEQLCILNGIEIRSIAHERCTEILLGGETPSPFGDWATILAANSTIERIAPHLLISGPSIAGIYPESIVRIGKSNQLTSLLNGSILTDNTPTFASPSEVMETKVNALLKRQLETNPHPTYLHALEQAAMLQSHSDLFPQNNQDINNYEFYEQIDTALTFFEQGLSRCVSVQYDGIWGIGWDSHSNIERQQLHFNSLFEYLLRLQSDLSERTDAYGVPLSMRVNVVVNSEMGRHPQLNQWNGRHHWTNTSAMLWGPNVEGNRSIGTYQNNGLGHPIDLVTGDNTTQGSSLRAEHLGATLLTMGDVDSDRFIQKIDPVMAMIR